MLGVSSYSKEYVGACRGQMEAQLAAYWSLLTTKDAAGSAEAATFGVLFFNNLILVLDSYFVHRLRGKEGKDGNPLNEVRMLANSILTGQARLLGDKTIKYKPDTAVLHLDVGDEICVDFSQFVALCEAYFSTIETTFADG